jgi:sulfocyanin
MTVTRTMRSVSAWSLPMYVALACGQSDRRASGVGQASMIGLADTGATAPQSPGPGPTKVNDFLSYNAASKTVNLKLFAAYNSQQGGFNFNGGSNGSHTITVPVGWTVNADVINKDAIPHSAIVIADQRPIPNAPDKPAIERAYTSHLTDGLAPQNGEDTMNFKAAPAGNFLIACGVPGHAPSGMFIKFVVSATAAAPTYAM